MAIKEVSRGPMLELPEVQVTCESGLAGDLRGKSGRRQVTLLSQRLWNLACNDIGVFLPWTTRRANIFVADGVLFGPAYVGMQLSIGSLILEITGETPPCERMDEIHPGLRAALSSDWRGGITCRVLESGIIRLNDPVILRG